MRKRCGHRPSDRQPAITTSDRLPILRRLKRQAGRPICRSADQTDRSCWAWLAIAVRSAAALLVGSSSLPALPRGHLAVERLTKTGRSRPTGGAAARKSPARPGSRRPERARASRDQLEGVRARTAPRRLRLPDLGHGFVEPASAKPGADRRCRQCLPSARRADRRRTRPARGGDVSPGALPRLLRLPACRHRRRETPRVGLRPPARVFQLHCGCSPSRVPLVGRRAARDESGPAVEVPEDIVERIRALCLALPEMTMQVDGSLKPSKFGGAVVGHPPEVVLLARGIGLLAGRGGPAVAFLAAR
jgi:hypothetical protein